MHPLSVVPSGVAYDVMMIKCTQDLPRLTTMTTTKKSICTVRLSESTTTHSKLQLDFSSRSERKNSKMASLSNKACTALLPSIFRAVGAVNRQKLCQAEVGS